MVRSMNQLVSGIVDIGLPKEEPTFGGMVMVKEREYKETPLFPLLSLTSRTGGMMPYSL